MLKRREAKRKTEGGLGLTRPDPTQASLTFHLAATLVPFIISLYFLREFGL